MKTPDKIYMHYGQLGLMHATEINVTGNDSVYISRDALMALLDAEKEETSIGLSEYDAGHENGRMEVIMSLTEKIKAL